jgi:regulator of sirC expression with transglutaminase-like and TPR domain
MNRRAPDLSASKPSAGQQAALLKLLTDEDPAIYQTVRSTILSCGVEVEDWLRPHTLSSDPVLRRRAREILRHFGLQAADIRFLAFCLKHGEEFDFEDGAWLLAGTEYPEINVEAYRALLDDYARELRQRLDLNDRPGQILGMVNEFLFDDLGFAGNEKDPADPQNSYLNRVLDRRTGNPISLCLVYLLVARRLQLPVTGIGLPGHFICRYQSSSDELYVDVFNRGRILTKADCIQYLVQGNHGLRDDFLSPVSARRLLLRLCSNLHRIYLQIERPEEATRLHRYLVALKGRACLE